MSNQLPSNFQTLLDAIGESDVNDASDVFVECIMNPIDGESTNGVSLRESAEDLLIRAGLSIDDVDQVMATMILILDRIRAGFGSASYPDFCALLTD